ncbi:MAG TPA: AzlD domain-containing protein [Candidatus Dormibacteraeota bacterium]|nr:AzlD domain-containing protein [Candidatus Dormibacteraeota bacterium]
MSLGLIALAILMGAVTYPSRAAGLLAPGVERLPPRILEYLRLVGPAVLAALAAVNVMVVVDAARHPSLHVGVEWAGVALAIALVAWRRNLFLGLVAAVALVAVARAVGIAPAG